MQGRQLSRELGRGSGTAPRRRGPGGCRRHPGRAGFGLGVLPLSGSVVGGIGCRSGRGAIRNLPRLLERRARLDRRRAGTRHRGRRERLWHPDLAQRAGLRDHLPDLRRGRLPARGHGHRRPSVRAAVQAPPVRRRFPRRAGITPGTGRRRALAAHRLRGSGQGGGEPSTRSAASAGLVATAGAGTAQPVPRRPDRAGSAGRALA